MTKILEVGDKAPDFTIPNQNGKIIKLENLLGKWSVIYFYPRDDSSLNLGFRNFRVDCRR